MCPTVAHCGSDCCAHRAPTAHQTRITAARHETGPDKVGESAYQRHAGAWISGREWARVPLALWGDVPFRLRNSDTGNNVSSRARVIPTPLPGYNVYIYRSQKTSIEIKRGPPRRSPQAEKEKRVTETTPTAISVRISVIQNKKTPTSPPFPTCPFFPFPYQISTFSKPPTTYLV